MRGQLIQKVVQKENDKQKAVVGVVLKIVSIQRVVVERMSGGIIHCTDTYLLVISKMPSKHT